MANDKSDSPWILDTAAIITDAAVKVLRMEWVPNATGDDIQIEDRNGRINWIRKAVFTNESPVQVFEGPAVFKGFEVAVIDGGTLYVWTDQSDLLL